MLRCKAAIFDAFEVYCKRSCSERQGASHFFTSLEDMLRMVGLTEKAMAMFTLSHYWG